MYNDIKKKDRLEFGKEGELLIYDYLYNNFKDKIKK
jgi:hypothetical protein